MEYLTPITKSELEIASDRIYSHIASNRPITGHPISTYIWRMNIIIIVKFLKNNKGTLVVLNKII